MTNNIRVVASRWVELSNLPDTFGPRDVTALVWGGAVEQVRYTPRASTAKIGFVSAACCANYHEQTASDIEYDFRMIKVEMIRDVPEPMTLEVMGHLQNGATRCVVATGPREDLTVGDIKKLAKEDGRQVEHVSIGRDTQGVRLTTLSQFELLLTSKLGAREQVPILQHRRCRLTL